MSHWDPARPTKALPGETFTAEIYLGPPARPDPNVRYGEDTPQAFLVEMGPGTELRTHYHPIDQFQVFVSGSGRFGRHDVAPGFAHYSDGNTPYGPLTPGERGVGFLTLRGRTDAGASFMPESSEELRVSLAACGRRSRERRNRAFPPSWSCRTGRWRWPMDEADGARSGRLWLDPAASGRLPAIGGAGAYVVTLSGAIDVERPCAAQAGGSLLWLPAGTPEQTVTAWDDGARLVFLQLPVPVAARDAVDAMR